MKLTQAIAKARKGKLIRRKGWEVEGHRREHLFYVLQCEHPDEEKCERRDCDEHFLRRNHLPPYQYEWGYGFLIEDIEASDWEVMSPKCRCFECYPKLHKPIKKGDLVDYEPCSGLRLVYEVTEANGSSPRTVYGDLRYIIDSDDVVIPFTVEKKKNHRGHIEHTVAYPEGTGGWWWIDNWVKAQTSAMEGFETISPGLPHASRDFNHHCKLGKGRLRELKKLLKEQ